MARYATVSTDDNVVHNLIVWDGQAPYSPPDGTVLVALPDDLLCNILWVYDPSTNTFSPPVDEG
jgi:hypothetical protein